MDVSQINRAAYESSWNLTNWYATGDGFEANERRLIVEFFPHPPARVLDLGCGGGRTTLEFLHMGYDVIAVDLSWTLLRRTRVRAGSARCVRMDAASLALPDASVDAVMFAFNGIDCLYPLEKRLSCMREVRRVLKPGGTFLFSTHNLIGLAFWGGRWCSAFPRVLRQQTLGAPLSRWYVKYVDEGGPQYLYSAPPARIRRQLADAGLSVVTIRGTRGQTGPWKVLLTEHHVDVVATKGPARG